MSESHLTTQKIIYFVRHGESTANRGNMFQPPDDELTDLGHKQIACLAARFATVDFDALLSSPFRRAYQTAQAIGDMAGKEVEVSELFREYVPPTSLHGASRDSEDGVRFMAQRKEHMADQSWHYEDEENYFDLHERAVSALTYLIERPEKTMVIATHLGFLKTIILAMLTKGEPDPLMYVNVRFLFESMNTGVTIARFGTDKRKREGWRLVTWNDFTHLPKELWGVVEQVDIV